MRFKPGFKAGVSGFLSGFYAQNGDIPAQNFPKTSGKTRVYTSPTMAGIHLSYHGGYTPPWVHPGYTPPCVHPGYTPPCVHRGQERKPWAQEGRFPWMESLSALNLLKVLKVLCSLRAEPSGLRENKVERLDSGRYKPLYSPMVSPCPAHSSHS